MIYALVVGISHYTAVPPLNGSLDAYDVADLLEAKFPGRVRVKLLVDRAASYDGIIKGFDHLRQAGQEDQAFFYFSGHGSRVKSAQEFQHLSSDGMDETILAFDSRKDGGLEISDKELAWLFAEVSRNCPHVAAFFDCCHSGNLLRGRVKEAPPLKTARLLATYHGDWKPGQPNELPDRHAILFTACNKWQYAEENTLEGRGNFTLAFRAALEKATLQSYQDLFLNTRGAILRYSNRQSPQLEVYGGMSPHLLFLGTEEKKPSQHFELRYEEAREGDGFAAGWYINLGAAHGLPLSPEKAGGIEVLGVGEKPLGMAGWASIGLEKSRLDLRGLALDKSLAYAARLRDVSLAPVLVSLQGLAGIPAQIAKDWEQNGFPLVKLLPEDLDTRYQLRVEGPDYELWQADRQQMIASTRDWAEMGLVLEKVCRWQKLLEMPDAALGAEEGQLFFEWKIGPKGAQDSLVERRGMVDLEAGQVFSRLELLLKGDAQGKWFWYFIALKGDYGIEVRDMDSFDGPGGWVQASKMGLGIAPEDYAPSTTEYFKLLVSKTEIDVAGLAQGGLKSKVPATRGKAGRISLRSWNAEPFALHAARRLGRLGETELELATGKLILGGHPSLKGAVAVLSGKPAIDRVPPADFLHQMNLWPLSFYDRDLAHFHVLEISQLEGWEDLTTEPWELKLAFPHGDAQLWPLLWDGEILRVAGRSAGYSGGYMRLRISTLGKPGLIFPPKERGAQVQICFFKTPPNTVDFEGMESRELEKALLAR